MIFRKLWFAQSGSRRRYSSCGRFFLITGRRSGSGVEAVRDALAGGGMCFGGGALSEMQTRIRTPHDRWRGEMQLLDECRF